MHSHHLSLFLLLYTFMRYLYVVNFTASRRRTSSTDIYISRTKRNPPSNPHV
ncbi:hypothetical protein CY34DRAFT_796935 [Suillus luteus UH-Slu-Lm8-n1]|uniref:Uncharacterized protein n=1 Tax=Suillus luteus UH-Slu-Lm8-n1 TaxID=930992 RepID=A0A0D0AHF5_9AGAM|nr:hypothetical protein CY34DRAFT_796935 [Suillus luteus UH-Slu-Lm8-n1]